jgi:hypothetical protein
MPNPDPLLEPLVRKLAETTNHFSAIWQRPPREAAGLPERGKAVGLVDRFTRWLLRGREK